MRVKFDKCAFPGCSNPATHNCACVPCGTNSEEMFCIHHARSAILAHVLEKHPEAQVPIFQEPTGSPRDDRTSVDRRGFN